MRHDELRIDLRLGKRGAEPRHAFWFDRALVAVELGDCREDLQRSHPRRPGSTRGHMDAAVIDRVTAKEMCHVVGSVERLIMPQFTESVRRAPRGIAMNPSIDAFSSQRRLPAD